MEKSESVRSRPNARYMGHLLANGRHRPTGEAHIVPDTTGAHQWARILENSPPGRLLALRSNCYTTYSCPTSTPAPPSTPPRFAFHADSFRACCSFRPRSAGRRGRPRPGEGELLQGRPPDPSAELQRLPPAGQAAGRVRHHRPREPAQTRRAREG